MRDLTQKDIGRKFSAIISGIPSKGKIQYDRGTYFLCQNERDGSACKNKLGYKFSWAIEDGKVCNLQRNAVKKLRIQVISKEDSDQEKVFDEGDVLVNNEVPNSEVIIDGKIGETLICRSVSMDALTMGEPFLSHSEKLFYYGWRLKVEELKEPQSIEMSVKDVATKLGIDPKVLKIIDKS